MSESTSGWLSDVGGEFAGARLPDRRLEPRIRSIMEALAAKTDASFPTSMGSPKALEGLYRLLNNPRVHHAELLAAHARNTAVRAQTSDEVLVLHDTSTFKFPHVSAAEIGESNTGKAGFLGHVSLVLEGNLSRCPLGVIALQTLHRKPGRARRGLSGPNCAKLSDRESARWLEGVIQAEHHLGPARAVHVMDREGDSYALYAQLLARNSRFVIRADDRTCLFEGENTHVREALSRQQSVVAREVALPRRISTTTAPDAVREPRQARVAKLAIASCQLTLKRPNYLKEPVAKSLELHAVRVFELDTPTNVEPIEWLILTNKIIEDEKQLQRIVDIYRCRWVIEEFFKALKTGCLYEERQLEERESLLMALVMFLPVACQLLWLRSRARAEPDAPATEIVTETQLQVVRTFSDFKLPPKPTLRQALWAIASMGGHLKNNGDPGWQTLGRGWRRLLDLEAGWTAALNSTHL